MHLTFTLKNLKNRLDHIKSCCILGKKFPKFLFIWPLANLTQNLYKEQELINVNVLCNLAGTKHMLLLCIFTIIPNANLFPAISISKCV